MSRQCLFTGRTLRWALQLGKAAALALRLRGGAAVWPLMGLLTGHRIKEELLGASLVGRGCWLCSTVWWDCSWAA